jgi:integrase
MAKAPAGTPQVKNSNGRLQIIVITPKGHKRKYLTLGLSDSKANRDYAETVRRWIENDIRGSRFDPKLFDPTLKKYERKLDTPEPDISTDGDITIRQLWDK